MSETKDPAIKLFGKTIQLTPNDDVSHPLDDSDERTSSDHNNNNNNCKNSASGEGSMDSEKEEETETSGSDEKALKKPDKILPCPRCNSMDTKFCYFNNYNVNQPRHFCKNCQRYWTAGGTMRNVPVGAGRRKNKNSSPSIPRYIVDTPNGMIYPPLRPNAPLCENGPAPPWLAQWNPVQWSSTVPPLPFPVPVYWSCGVPGSSGANSPLGKHPREGVMPSNNEKHGEEKKTETKVLVPKTLRIDDPSEAAKSSIWTTLGIKHENTKPRDSGVFFRGLQSKGISSGAETSSVLQANPAALSRSMTYHERAE